MSVRAWFWSFAISAVLWSVVAFTVLTILGDVT